MGAHVYLPLDTWRDFEPTIAAVKDVVEHHPLRYIGHFTRGQCDFSVDTLADGNAPEEHRNHHRRIGGRLTFAIGQIDDRLRGLRTGPVIRAVVQTEEGIVVLNSVVRLVYIVGVARNYPRQEDSGGAPALPGPVELHECDDAVSRLATRLRGIFPAPDQHPGGDFAQVVAQGQRRQSHEPPVRPDDPQHGRALSAATSIRELQLAALSEQGLHYTAFFRNRALVSSAHLFQNPSLAKFFETVTPAERIRIYDEFGFQIPGRATELSQLVRRLVGSRLQRLVLDVERGAIYIYRVDSTSFMIGVTLDQDFVGSADEAMFSLTTRSKELVRGAPASALV